MVPARKPGTDAAAIGTEAAPMANANMQKPTQALMAAWARFALDSPRIAEKPALAADGAKLMGKVMGAAGAGICPPLVFELSPANPVLGVFFSCSPSLTQAFPLSLMASIPQTLWLQSQSAQPRRNHQKSNGLGCHAGLY
jgi:hypothetical protein